MDIKYYVDWCPISTLPVHNCLWKTDGLTRNSVQNINQPELVKLLFNRYSELMMFEYAMRLDGLLVFRIGLLPNTTPAIVSELSNELSDLIKSITGHKHDFHAYPYSEVKFAVKGWRKAYSWCKHKCQILAHELHLSTNLMNQLDIDLHIRPVEIEDPFDENFKLQTHKNFNALSQLIDPSRGDTALAQLRVREGKESAQRACLRLRALFAGKKERCLIAYQRRERSINSLVPSMVYGILLGAIIFLGLQSYFSLGPKTSFAISFVTGFGLFIFLDDRLQAPKLEVIQRALGFYAYANIYSSLTEAMYRKTNGGPSFNNDTGNFNDLMDALKARLDLERQAIANRKYLWTIIFAVIATTFALTKLSIELEKLTEKPMFEKNILDMEYFAQITGADKANSDVENKSIEKHRITKIDMLIEQN